MKQLEQHFNINLFDRFNLAYRDGEEVKSLPRACFWRLFWKRQEINTETIVYNNMVQNVAEHWKQDGGAI